MIIKSNSYTRRLTHLVGVPRQAESGDVGTGWQVELTLQLRGLLVQLFHPLHSLSYVFRVGLLAFESGGGGAKPEWLGERQDGSQVEFGFWEPFVRSRQTHTH